MKWARSAAEIEALATADYPFPTPNLKFLGVVIQRYRLRSRRPTKGFRKYFDRVADAVTEQLNPALREAGLVLPDDAYRNAKLEDDLWLASIAEFNTLIAYSQRTRKPVFALDKADVERTGSVWISARKNIERFRATFEQLAQRVEYLTNYPPS
jgi:hypothetical protein